MEVELPYGIRAAAAGRRAVEPFRRSMPAPAFEAMRLLLTELVTNTVLHAGLDRHDVIVMRVETGAGRTLVEVEDPGHGFTVKVVTPGQSGLGGRGLDLVDRLSARWGIARADAATRVWAELDHPSGAGTTLPHVGATEP
jgi:anti-sigma regulatory factor (Ser/Thr protein kinase)